LENILCSSEENKSAAEKFYGELPKWVKNLHVFGEVAIISDQKNKLIRSKLADRGFPAIFIGYSEDHAIDVLEFFNDITKGVLLSRNVIWLNKNYGQYMNITDVHTTKIGESDEEQEDEESDEVKNPVNFEAKEETQEIEDELVEPVNTRLEGEIKRLTCEWNLLR
jgi:hypothetical protein